MKRISFCLLSSLTLLITPTTTFGLTPWEQFLNSPNDENAKLVEKISYSQNTTTPKDAQPEVDFSILEKQMLEGRLEAYFLAFRLSREVDGANSEDLKAAIGRTLRPQAKVFLLALHKDPLPKRILKSILEASGLEYVDRPEAEKHELSMRAKALSAVKDPTLKEAKKQCLQLLNES